MKLSILFVPVWQSITAGSDMNKDLVMITGGFEKSFPASVFDRAPTLTYAKFRI